MPDIISKPVIISSFEIFLFFMIGSKTAVKSVRDDRQTNATETVDDFMD